MELYVSQFLIFLMIFVRVMALVVVAPMIGHMAVPIQVKVAIGLFVAFVMYPLASHEAAVVHTELIPLVLAVFKEAAVGLLIGFAAGLLFAGVRFAGELIAIDAGLSLAALFDPESHAHASVISESLYLLMLMVFVMVDGHHVLLEALQLSYVSVPMGSVALNGELAEHLLKMVGMVFVVAVKLAAPVMVAMFLINVALSILARVMPQMNLFAVLFPLKVGVGLLVLTTALPLLVFVFKKLLAGFEESLFELVKVL
ncbi:MAG: flagellar biosynthetic protein FliR [Ignavibacteria bacterium]